MDGDSGQGGKCRSQGKLTRYQENIHRGRLEEWGKNRKNSRSIKGMSTENEERGKRSGDIHREEEKRVTHGHPGGRALKAHYCARQTNPNRQPNGFYDLPHVIVGATGPPGVGNERIRVHRAIEMSASIMLASGQDE
ncbi:hypothetical protein JB92DRAFT_2839270 [Gautieria morchelliformis]|nr:hypothetical protein JB92DRAFT_2839270 [Gautieria morchelliformis]